MIEFYNGHRFDFGCASGALAFDGRGWWYDKPCLWSSLGLGLWSNLLRPEEFTIITKTLTYEPVIGNYRWWCPWRCTWPVEDGMVNAVALTNPGYYHWIDNDYPAIVRSGYKVIASFMPHNVYEAEMMTCKFNHCDRLVGLQMNGSCPNVGRIPGLFKEILFAVLRLSELPVTVKLAYQDDYVGICRWLQELRLPAGKHPVAAVELINTVPHDIVFPGKRSPLARYNLVGGVSGPKIKSYAREALEKVIKAGITIPVITGGGNDSLEEVLLRESMGAKGYTFGTLFMWRAWEPNQIITRYRKMRGYSWC